MEVLQKSRLFQGMSPEEINGVLGCMAAKEQCYEKGSFIVNQGDRMTQLHGAYHQIGLLGKPDDYVRGRAWGNLRGGICMCGGRVPGGSPGGGRYCGIPS